MSVKISQLSASSDITSDDFFPVVDSGSLTTKRASAQQMLDYVTGSTFDTLTVTTLGGITAQFTIITGSTVTGSTAQFTTVSASNLVVSGGNAIFYQAAVIGDNAYILYDSSIDKLAAFPGLYVTGAITASTVVAAPTGAFTILSGSTITGSTALFSNMTASTALFSGDIRVLGTASITQLNTVGQTSLLIGDKYITILSGGVDHTGVNGSGFLWGSSSGAGETTGALGEHAHILYDASRDALEIFPGLYVTGSTTVFGISGTTAQFTTITGSTIKEITSGTAYDVATQYDIGTLANQIPLNQYLGTMAYQDNNAIVVGTITGSTATFTNIGVGTLSGSSGNITISGSLSGMIAALTSSATNYVFVAADSGKVVVLSSSSGITASIPTGLPVGFTTTIVQNGSGSIFVSASSGVVIRNRQNHTRTAGLYATVAIIGTGSNSYIFAGDTTS
jgi:hypothetical protein